MNKEQLLAGLFIAVFFNIFFFPIVFIWAINTLFMTSIEINFWNWLASFVILAAFRGAKVIYNKGA